MHVSMYPNMILAAAASYLTHFPNNVVFVHLWSPWCPVVTVHIGHVGETNIRPTIRQCLNEVNCRNGKISRETNYETITTCNLYDLYTGYSGEVQRQAGNKATGM